MFKFIINFCAILIISVSLYSQVVVNPSSKLLKDKTMKSLLVNGQSLLYNGFNFYDYAPNYFESGHPFFLENSWLQGNVSYESNAYYQVPLKYDLLKDELIVQHFDKLSSINLVKSKVNDFSINGHKFIHLQQTDNTSAISDGFYEELYHNKLILLAKRKKTVVESVTQSGVKRNIDMINKYYIYKAGVFYQYNSLSSLSKVLKDRKKELSIYMKSNKQQFKKEPEKAMVAIATYYDQVQK